jgi:hypothetical protein
MKKRNFFLMAFVALSIMLSFNSCKDDTPAPAPTIPTMTTMDITAADGNFIATVNFSEGVYKNNNATGNLDDASFSVSIQGGTATLASYSVAQTAGQSSAVITVELGTVANGSETLVVKPASGTSIYGANGGAMSANESMSTNMVGTVTINYDINGTGTTTWTSNNIYLLNGLIFVNDGQTLTIEPGTVIKGKPGQGENASALIVAKGGTLLAEGTAEKPIIFTAEADDLQGSVPDLDNGPWGGVIVLGKAVLNTVPSVQQIEGIPTTEARGAYGGTDDNDNSGVLKYISIRHGGTDIGEGNEINGLTLGAVGRNTTIEYIEIFSNKDDGIEFFGGVPRLNHIVVAFCGDDCYDYDQGFSGFGQFWFAVQGYNRGDRMGEHDGGTDPEDGQPFAIPYIYNVTYMGQGSAAGKRLVTFRDNAGGHYANSIMYNQAKGVDVELLTSTCSYNRYEQGQLTVENSIYYEIAQDPIFNIEAASDVTDADKEAAQANFSAYFATAGNTVQDPGLVYNENAAYFNPIPTNAVGGSMSATPDAWFESTNYKGAFNPSGPNWAAGWTLFSKYMND